MRREQESWKKEECIIKKRCRSTKETNMIHVGRTDRTSVVAVFYLCTGHTPSNLAIYFLLWIVGVCFSVEMRGITI
jgi:hypothetical protein